MVNPPAHSLRSANWNACGVSKKYLELYDFLLEFDIDFICISETHLNLTDRFNFPNYTTYRTDRLHHRGGGAAIIIKKSIPSCLIASERENGYEVVTIRAHLRRYGNINISAIYNPPYNLLTNNDLSRLFPTNSKTLLAGDLNSKNTAWGCRRTNQNGETIFDYAEAHDLFVHPPDYATFMPHFANCQPDILDICITNFSTVIPNFTHELLSSDHWPTIQYIADNKPKDTKEFKKVDWILYQNIMQVQNLNIPDMKNTQDIEDAIEKLKTGMKEALEGSTMTVERNVHAIKLPPKIKQMITIRNRVKKLWKRTLNPEYRSEANRLSAKIRIDVNIERGKQWTEKMTDLSQDSKKMWNFAKTLKTERPVNRPIHTNTKICYSEEDKAEAFADAMEAQFSENAFPSDNIFQEQTINIVKNYLQNTNICNHDNPNCSFVNCEKCCVCNSTSCTRKHLCNSDLNRNYYTDATEVINYIKALKPKKAPGPDLITNSMIRSLPLHVINVIVKIFNMCLKLNYFPKNWKKSNIVLFPKQGQSPFKAENYRPISLLDTLGKLFEKVILERLKSYMHLIPDTQMGFMKQRSTTHQLVKIVEIIASAFKNKQTAALLLIDFSKAFDRVSHPGLLRKLIELKIPRKIITLIASYLNERKFQIKINNTISSTREINSSVPQGSLLSPTLFLFYVADFPSWPEDPNTHLNQYADDVALVSTSKKPNYAISRIKSKINEIEDWCKKWKVLINARKSKLLVIRKTHPRQPLITDVNIFNETVTYETKTKYLGIIINNRLSWSDHIDYSISKANGMYLKLLPLVGRYSNLDKKNKVQLINACIKSILTYASPAWATISNSGIKRLAGSFNKKLKTALDAPRYMRNINMYKDLNMPSLEDFINQANAKFFLKNLSNPALERYLNYQIYVEDMDLRPLAKTACTNAELFDAAWNNQWQDAIS